MDKHKQRMAIAKACGWIYDYVRGDAMFFIPKGYYVGDPLNDLNAMREALLTLNTEQRHAIAHEVGDILKMPNPNDWQYHDFLYVSASELAEAFLKTLNLWEANK